MIRRSSTVISVLLGAALLLPVSQAHALTFLHEQEIDGILFIQAVGSLPDIDDVDGDQDILANDKNVQNECFDHWVDATPTFEIISSVTWGDDIDRIRIGARTADDFGFQRDHTYDDPDDGSDDPAQIACKDFESQWNEYSEPSGITILVTGDIGIVAGATGTEVRVDEGVGFSFFPGSSLAVEGSDDDPVVLRGDQWSGLSFQSDTSATFENCVVRQASRTGITAGPGSDVQVRACEFENNENPSSLGSAIRAVDPAGLLIEDSVFRGNDDSALYVQGASVELNDVTFDGNESISRGGAIHLRETFARLANVTVVDNEAGRGGGLYVRGGTAHIANALIAGNTGRSEGGGLQLIDGANVTLYNPTIAFNDSNRGGAIDVSFPAGSQLDIRNAIIAGNELRDPDTGIGPQIANLFGDTIHLRRVMLDGGLEEGHAGSGPATAELVEGRPGFRSLPDEPGAGGGSAQADWHLQGGSDAINRGDGDLFSAGGFPDVDRDGEGRVFGSEAPAIDLGVYEFPNNPPTLLDTAGETYSLDESDEALALELCGSYSDTDSHPDADPDRSGTRQQPWLTRAPGDDTENLGGDPEGDAEDLEENAGGSGYGNVTEYDGGDPGDPVRANNAIGDPGGRAFYRPGNRSASYETVVTCRVRDEIADAEGEVDQEHSMLSDDRKQVTVEVSARNDTPEFDGELDTEATVGRDYETELSFSDPDADHAARDLDVRVVEGPDWLELRRTGEDEVTLGGQPEEEGEFDVEYEVVDTDGGTTVQRTTIVVDSDDDLEPIEAGGDQSAEPGERVRLSADGPDDPDLLYEWRIFDADGNELASQSGQTYNWTAEQGLYTATALLIEGGEIVDDDSLSVAVEEGFSGSVDEEERTAPTAEQERQLDGMSGDGTGEDVDDWEAQSDGEKATALAELAGTELTQEQADAVLDEAGDLLAEATADGEPLDPGLAGDLADAYGSLTGLELTDDQRDTVLSGMDALREQAEEDDAGSDALTAGLVKGASGLMSAPDELGVDERDRILTGLDDDLAAAVDDGRSLDDPTVNRSLAALGNAGAGPEMGEEQIDQLFDGLDNALEAGGDLSSTQLTKAATVISGLLDERDGKGLTDAQRDRVEALGRKIVQTGMAGGRDINATGSHFLKLAATTIPAATEGDVLIGNGSEEGPSVVISEAARRELRRRNAIADGDAMALAVVATLRGEDSSHIVEVIATDSTGEPLADTSLEESIRLTIPVTRDGHRRPVTARGSPATTDNVDTGGRGVSFDTGELAAFTLTAEIEPDDERSDSDKASCFLDSLF